MTHADKPREFTDEERWRIHASLDVLLKLHEHRHVDAYRMLDEVYTKFHGRPA